MMTKASTVSAMHAPDTARTRRREQKRMDIITTTTYSTAIATLILVRLSKTKMAIATAAVSAGRSGEDVIGVGPREGDMFVGVESSFIRPCRSQNSQVVHTADST